MLVGEIMEPDPLTVAGSEPFERLLTVMSRDRSPRLACVVDETGRLVGVVTSFDLLRSCLGGTGFFRLFAGEQEDMNRAVLRGCGLTAGDMMTKRPKSLRQDDSAIDAVRLIVSERIGSLPVTDEAGRPVGLVGRNTLLKLFDAKRRDRFLPQIDAELRRMRDIRSAELKTRS